MIDILSLAVIVFVFVVLWVGVREYNYHKLRQDFMQQNKRVNDDLEQTRKRMVK